MSVDHPTITATNSAQEPERLERINRVYGYALALADAAGNTQLVDKLNQLHDHRDSLLVFWQDLPDVDERRYFARAWASQIGAGNNQVEHEC